MMGKEKPNVLVIRHEKGSSLGLLGTLLYRNDIPYHYLDAREGEVLSQPLTDYSHVVVLGGAISAYEHEQYPYLRHEFKILEEAIAKEIPVLGICLGSQILAKVLGARVYRGESGREIGWCEIQLTRDAAADPLFQDFPEKFRVFQSHQDTFEIPPDCVHLASSDKYPCQAFRYRDRVWAIQFHLDIDEYVLSDCADVIEWELADSNIQDTNFAQLLEGARYHAPFVAPLTDSLMQHFLQL